jgi:predicted Fe-Mo cluster-binding NifX family protein
MPNRRIDIDLQDAAQYGHPVGLAKMLIEAGADVNVRSKFGTSAFASLSRTIISKLRRC